jgi:hypothetical protein
VLAVVGILGLLLILGLTGNSSENGASSTTTTTATRHHAAHHKATSQAKHHAPPAPRTVKLRIEPATPTYICVDKGLGTAVVYEATLAGTRTFVARHLRVNLGRRAVTLIANGRHVRVPPGAEPIGYDFRPKGYRTIPPTQKRPCT